MAIQSKHPKTLQRYAGWRHGLKAAEGREAAMRRLIFTALAAAAASAPVPAKAGPNVPLCLVIEKNFSDCVRRHDRTEWRYREEYEDWEEEGGWVNGPPPQAPLDCNAWLVQLQANHCY